MADDDDWGTDAGFENTMTEEQKRRAGNPELLAQKQQETASGMTMNAVRSKSLASSELPMDQKNRKDGYQKPGDDQTTTKEPQKQP